MAWRILTGLFDQDARDPNLVRVRDSLDTEHYVPRLAIEGWEGDGRVVWRTGLGLDGTWWMT